MIQLTTLRVQKKTTKGYLLIIVFSHTILINYLYINIACVFALSIINMQDKAKLANFKNEIYPR